MCWAWWPEKMIQGKCSSEDIWSSASRRMISTGRSSSRTTSGAHKIVYNNHYTPASTSFVNGWSWMNANRRTFEMLRHVQRHSSVSGVSCITESHTASMNSCWAMQRKRYAMTLFGWMLAFDSRTFRNIPPLHMGACLRYGILFQRWDDSSAIELTIKSSTIL